jgi:CDP-diacylglycerol--glycerol-3-phosphate 3-phosphatidyltransferase
MTWINVPNMITMLRLVLLAPALILFMKGGFSNHLTAWILVLVMEFSDMMDGIVARWLHQETDVGKILDPFGDHIYRLSFFLFFHLKGLIPLWMFLILFYRDSLVLNLRIFASSKKSTFVGARLSGKIKAYFQSGAIFLFCLLQTWPPADPSAQEPVYFWFMAAVCAVTLWSAFDYLLGITRK